MAVTDELYASDLVLHGSTGADIHGIENYKQYASKEFDAFPDLHYTIDDMVAEGDKVSVRLTATGTHKGEFMGIHLPIRRLLYRRSALTVLLVASSWNNG